MANRKLPFGYEMQRGIVCVKAAEAAIVKEIYAAYIRGISYRQITDSLNVQAVPYNEPGSPGTKIWWPECSAMNFTPGMRLTRQFCLTGNTGVQSAQSQLPGLRSTQRLKQSGSLPGALPVEAR